MILDQVLQGIRPGKSHALNQIWGTSSVVLHYGVGMHLPLNLDLQSKNSFEILFVIPFSGFRGLITFLPSQNDLIMSWTFTIHRAIPRTLRKAGQTSGSFGKVNYIERTNTRGDFRVFSFVPFKLYLIYSSVKMTRKEVMRLLRPFAA